MIMKKRAIQFESILILFTLFFTIIFFTSVNAQSAKYFGEKKVVPQIPPKESKIRLLIVSDATNEIDDIWAIALALLYPERFIIEGFVGSNYDHTSMGIGPESIERSVNEILAILEKAGLKGKYPVYPGGHPMQYEFYPSHSKGCDFIVERAMAGSPENPLWIVGLGSATDLASAYLKAPEIKDRIIMFWHGRTHPTWPYRAINYNVKGDMHAARMLFHAPFPFVLFDTGTDLTAGDLKESENFVKPYGDLGKYLYDYRLKNTDWSGNKKGFFDLGDIAVLIDPGIGKWEEVPCPTINYYMDYNFLKINGKLLRCYGIDRDKAFQLLYNGLSRSYKK
ncbi:MAG TPA: nucleoside hydrolase [Niabella sp.]|nr:nucleoside hydrolase [Niabella sp.]